MRLDEAFNLPWTTLLALACGYAGYFISHVGIRDHHKSIDVTFITLVYGFVSLFAYTATRLLCWDNVLFATLVAFVVGIAAGGLWRKHGRALLIRAMRWSGVSYSDSLPSAWLALFHEEAYAKQLSVKLKDGSWLKSDNLAKFHDLPEGPCVFGGNGDLLLYATHFQPKDESSFKECPQVIHPTWGAEITYIPASEIARVDIRRIRK